MITRRKLIEKGLKAGIAIGVVGQAEFVFAKNGVSGRLSDPSDGIRSRGHIVGMGPGDSKQPQQSQKKKRVSERTLIENVQKKLAQKGYNPGPADGVLGGNTINAIRSF